uniref:Uncharacterized protein n=1 Tax=Anguilla anguilla TaxID=7936 RepID=A0A0E9W569_ANGAN
MINKYTRGQGLKVLIPYFRYENVYLLKKFTLDMK